jgi:RNA polymerase sigma-70 factor (ECF subfamily)
MYTSAAIPADVASFETLMRRYNPRLFRVARSILKDDAEAEDALQEAYIQAYRHIAGFQGKAEVGTWLTRIVINQALMRLRKRKRERVVVPLRSPNLDLDALEGHVADPRAESPADTALRGEVRKILERRIGELPVTFRTVFVMREVEEMTVDETAECLGIPAATVRTRLFRARSLLRESLERDMDTAKAGVFGFAGARCDRIVAAVLARIR